MTAALSKLPEDDMVLRVAVAIAECSTDGPFEDWSERYARAAIEAMREPTEAMKEAAFGPIRDGGRHGPVTSDYLRRAGALVFYSAMIDAALASHPATPEQAA